MVPMLRRRGSFAAALLFGLQLGAASAQTATKPIRIGVLTDLSGNYHDVGGQGSVEAAKMAAEEFGGRIGDRPIEVVVADGLNKPDTASAIARQWYDAEGVGIILDLPASSVAFAVQEVARSRGKISVVTGGGSSDLTGKSCSPTGFHWVWDTYAMSHGTGRAVTRAGGNSWFFITGDYAAALTLEQETSEAVLEAGGKVLGSAKHPFPNFDFSSQLLRAQQSGAKVIGLANGGQDTINAIKQAAEFGITPAQTMAGLIIYISDVHALGLEKAAGLEFVTGFYWDRTEETRAWSKRFGARMDGAMPTMSQAGVYSAARHYLQAVKDLGDDDGPRVAAKMKATPVDDILAHGGVLRKDGRMVHEMYLVQVKRPQDAKAPWDYYKIVETIPAADAFRPLDKGGCSLVTQ